MKTLNRNDLEFSRFIDNLLFNLPNRYSELISFIDYLQSLFILILWFL